MQKYRLYLTRLQKEKENETKSSFAGLKHPDPSPKDPPGGFSLHNPTTIHQTDVVNSSYRVASNNLLPRSVDPSSHENELKSLISEPVMEPKRSPVNLHDSQNSKSSQMGYNPFQKLKSEVGLAAFNSGVPTKSYWGEVSDIQFRQEHKPLVHSEDVFAKLPLPDPLNHVHADPLQSIPSTAERGIPGPTKSKPPYGNNQISPLSPKVSTSDSFPYTSKSHLVNYQQALEPPIYNSTTTLTTQASSHLSCTADMESVQRNLNLGNESSSSLASLEDDLQVLFQGDYYEDPLGVNFELSGYGDDGFNNENPFHLYDSMRFGCEYSCDPAVIDHAY